MSVRISPAEYSETLAKIAKINERAVKKGFTGRLTVEAERIETTSTNVLGFQVTEVWYDVKITGEAPSYNGWTFLAVLDFDEHAGLITRVAPGAETNIDRSRVEAGKCDHCKITRQRNRTYVVLNVETGEQVQVGSTCIKDFLGWEGRPVFLSAEEVEEDIERGFGGYHEPVYTVDTVLAVAWACIKANGFTPASAYGYSTGSQVRTVLDPRSKHDQEFAAGIRPYVADSAEAAVEVREFILSEEFSGTTEYVINLKAVAAADQVNARNIGLLASAPQAWAKAQERTLIAKAKAEKPSEWFGEEKEKVEFSGVIEAIRYIESAYGSTVLYSIRNAEDGRIVKWFASREALGDKTGVEVKIKGTVKGHEEFRGIKSTVLTRCKAL